MEHVKLDLMGAGLSGGYIAMSLRTCSLCDETYPETLDYFHKNYRDKVGLDTCCKECRNKKHVAYRKKNRKRIKLYDSERTKRFREKVGIHSTAIHKYIKKRKSKLTYCFICNKEKVLQLASIGHTYTRKPEDYMWLCQSCHFLLDKCMKEMII